MKIILLHKIVNLGNLGDQVKVKAGYARNFLIPQGKAVLANKENIEKFKSRRLEIEKRQTLVRAEAQERANKINALANVIIASKAGHTGKLFGSVGARDISAAINSAGINVKKSEIKLPNGVLRATGTYMINVQTHSDIVATVNVIVVSAEKSI